MARKIRCIIFFVTVLGIITFNTNCKTIYADELNDISEINNLVEEGKQIVCGDGSDPDDFYWISKVNNMNEKYMDSQVYADIKSECESAKRYSSVNTFNTANKIIGYLYFLCDRIKGEDTKKIEDLISEGIKIANQSLSDYQTYFWLMNVQMYNEKHKDFSMYKELKIECDSAKGYTDINTFNTTNKIVSYLCYAQEISQNTQIVIGDLIHKGNKIVKENLTDYTSYLWLLEVYHFNELNKDSSIYSDVKTECASAKSYSNVNTFNCANKIIGYLLVLQEEKLYTLELQSIEISRAPNKVVYKEGEFFDKTGMQVDAKYNCIYDDGTTGEYVKKNVPYVVEGNKKLKASDTGCMISFTDSGVTKTIIQPITVESYIVSTLLENIFIAKKPKKIVYKEGEKFDKTGMAVNAIYKNIWSNGYVEYKTVNNIDYKVNTSSPLMKGDLDWMVTFFDKGVKKATTVKITVKKKKSKKNTIGKISNIILRRGKKKISVFFKKKKGCLYQIKYSKYKSMRLVKTKNSIKNRFLLKKLERKKKYYIKVRAYRKVNGKKVYGKWSPVLHIKTK